MGTEYSKQDIENAARLVPGLKNDNGCIFAIDQQKTADYGHFWYRAWQPWADTEAGRADWAELFFAVMKWLSAMDSVNYSKWPRAAFDVELLLQEMGAKESLFEVQAATFAAAAAIGAHMKGVEG